MCKKDLLWDFGSFLSLVYSWPEQYAEEPGRVESFKRVKGGMKSWVVGSSSVVAVDCQVGKCKTLKAKSKSFGSFRLGRSNSDKHGRIFA